MSASPNSLSALTAAEDSAKQQAFATDSAVLPCQKHAIEIVVWNESDQPLAHIPVELRRPMQVSRSKTDSSGLVRFDGLPDESYQYTLPTLDADAWEQIRETNVATGNGPDAQWTSAAVKAAAPQTSSHP